MTQDDSSNFHFFLNCFHPLRFLFVKTKNGEWVGERGLGRLEVPLLITYCHTNHTMPDHTIPYNILPNHRPNQESGSIRTAPLGSSDHCRQLMTSLKWPRSLIFICRPLLTSSLDPPPASSNSEEFLNRFVFERKKRDLMSSSYAWTLCWI